MTSSHDHAAPAEGDHLNRPWELYFAIAAGIGYVAGLLAEYALDAPTAVVTGLYLSAYVFGGYFTIRGAIRAIRQGHFEVDFLMLVAAVGAGAIGRFGEGAVLLFLFSLGHALEEYALSRASRSIDALAALAPRTGTVRLADGSLQERPVEDLATGDVLLVRPHTRVPADGFLTLGTTSVDQSAVTGESMPVDKVPVADADIDQTNPDDVPSESRLFAGTVNGSGAVEMVVTAAAADSTLARVIALVREADTATSPTQVFINRFQRAYVPAVIAMVSLVLVAGVLIGTEPFADGFYRAMLVLVAASPCALAVATPAAVLSGLARSARAGVLTKGGAPLETLAKVETMAFDKTGTLTWGHPSVTDVLPGPGIGVGELRAVAVATESLSDHPLAKTIVRDLSGKVPDATVPEATLPDATDLDAIAGRGVRARIAGDEVLIGNRALMAAGGLSLPPEVASDVDELERQGRTIMIVSRAGRVLGVIGVLDRLRLESRDTLDVLRRDGVSELVMISGDHPRVAQAVGAAAGVDTAVGGLLPEDKVAAIRDLGRDGRVTCMVGDGVNDAPAMAYATIGIAMGAAGSAVALDSADIALMSDDLGRLPFARRLSRATGRIIRQNLIISMAMVAVLVPASLMGLAMGPVVLLHEGSTILVVLNALRLLRFEPDGEHTGITHEERPTSH